MKNCYNPSLDEKIFEIVENNNNNEIQFNTLVVLLNKSSRTISKHLKFLEYKEIIIRKKGEPGKKGSIQFTPSARTKRELGILTIDYTGERGKSGICKEWRENFEINNIIERKKKIILFLLTGSAYGYTDYSYKVTSESRLTGGTTIKDVNVSISSARGFSTEDLDRVDRNDSELFHRITSPILRILRLNRFTKSAIEAMLKELKKKGIITFREVIGNNGKKERNITLKKVMGKDSKLRYDIEDEVLKELLILCFKIMTALLSLMFQYWFILGKYPLSKDEAQWYTFIVGEEAAADLFLKIKEDRATKKKKTIKELFAEYHFKNRRKKILDRYLKPLEAHYPNIFTKKGMEDYIFNQSKESIVLHKYCNLIASDKEKYQELVKEEKYQWIFEELVKIVNPPFSRNKYKVKLT
jgi:DNA-binding transcriptional ArsR family regulator